jgi:hypothetical protein
MKERDMQGNDDTADGHANHTNSKPAFNTKRSIVSKQNCRGPGQFCLDTTDLFVLEDGFGFVWLMS